MYKLKAADEIAKFIRRMHPSTFAAIKEMAAELKSDEIEIVPVSELTALQ